MGSVSGRTTVQVHLAHSYSETCGDSTGEMPGLSLLLIQEQSLYILCSWCNKALSQLGVLLIPILLLYITFAGEKYSDNFT